MARPSRWPFLSRLAKEGIGKHATREAHDQCYAAHAEGKDLRGLVATASDSERRRRVRRRVGVVGKEALSERDVKFLEFADLFEDKFVRQGKDEDRSIENTLDLAWKLLGHIPTTQLTRLDRKLIEEYYPKEALSAQATPAKK